MLILFCRMNISFSAVPVMALSYRYVIIAANLHPPKMRETKNIKKNIQTTFLLLGSAYWLVYEWAIVWNLLSEIAERKQKKQSGSFSR